MGKFTGNCLDLKKAEHPLLKKPLYLPVDYEFYQNGAEKEKFSRTFLWLSRINKRNLWSPAETIVLDAFAGAGGLAMIYLDFGYKLIAVEKNPFLFSALKKNILDAAGEKRKEGIHPGDNMSFLPMFRNDDSKIGIIDLDSYNSSVPQIRQAARILKNGFLFVTAGDIYAGARFKNWRFAKARYGIDFSGPAEDYVEKVIFQFIKNEFKRYGKSVELRDWFSFPQICRLSVQVKNRR